MAEAVIVATARTPIGRARKGSLVDVRPDDLLAFAIRSALDKVPELAGPDVCDVIAGCAAQEGKQGGNIARRAAFWPGCPTPCRGRLSTVSVPPACRPSAWHSTRSRPAR